MRTMTLMLVCMFASVGCTAVKVERLDPSVLKEPGDIPGVVYYEPEPFLRVIVNPKKDKASGALIGYDTSADVVYLPNKNRPYSINSDRTGAQNNLQVTLADGWKLVSVNGTSDPQIDEGIKAVAEVVSSVTGLVEKSNPDRVRVFLIHISMDDKNKIVFGDPVEVELQ